MKKSLVLILWGIVLRAEYFIGDTLHFYKNKFGFIFKRDPKPYTGVIRYKTDNYYIVSQHNSWRISSITSYIGFGIKWIEIGCFLPSFGEQSPDYVYTAELEKIVWSQHTYTTIDTLIDGELDMEIYKINVHKPPNLPLLTYFATNEGVMGRRGLYPFLRKIGLIDTFCYDVVIHPESIFSSSSDTEIIYIATPYGVYRGEVEYIDFVNMDSLGKFNRMGILNDTVYSLAIDSLLGLWAGAKTGLYKWENGWVRKGDSLSINNIKIFDSQKIVASTKDGIMYSLDGGATWQRNLLGKNIKGIEFYRGNYYVISYGEGVLKALSLSQSIWTDISSGLEVLENFGSKNINTIYKDPLIDSLFIGTDQGIYVFNTQKSKWVNIGVNGKILDDIIIEVIKDSIKPDSIFFKEKNLLMVSDTELYDVDGDPRIFLIVTNIVKSSDTTLRGIFTCYFDPYDEDTTNPYANGFEGFVLNLEEIYSDNIFPYNVKRIRNVISYLYGKYIFWSLDKKENVLLLTGFGMLTGYLCGIKSLLVGMKEGFDIKYTHLKDYGLFEFKNIPHNYVEMDEYGKEKIFFFLEYLFERTDTNFIRYFLRDTLKGEEGIDSVLIKNGYNLTTETIFKDWIIANYINYPDTSFYNGIYGYKNVDSLPFKKTQCVLKTWSSYPIPSFPPQPNIPHIGKYSFSCHLFENGSAPITIYFDGENEDTFYNVFIPIDYLGRPLEIYQMDLDILRRGFKELNGFGSIYDKFIFIISKIKKGRNGRFKYDDNPLIAIHPPQNLKAFSHYPSYIPLKWEAPPIKDFYFYKIYRSFSPNGPFILIDTTSSLFYKDTTVLNDTVYYYTVTANYGNEESPFSNIDSAFANQFPPPQNIRGMSFSNIKTYLLWDMPYGYSFKKDANFWKFLKMRKGLRFFSQPELTGFRVYRKLKNSPDTFLLIADSLNSLFYIDSVPVPDTSYLYGITAIYSNPAGESKIYDTLEISAGSYNPNYKVIIPIKTGKTWSYTTNYGNFSGGEWNAGLWGYSHPMINPMNINNYYLWASYFSVGFVHNGDTFVTTHDYPDGEWGIFPYIKIDDYFSDLDITTVLHDFYSNTRNASGRQSGLQVIQRTLSWKEGILKYAIAHEFLLIYYKDSSGLQDPPDTLKDVYVAFWMDFDVSGGDMSDPHIDDLVDYEGYDRSDTYTDEIDSITLYPDGTYDTLPDGFPDEFDIFGDEPDEVTLNGDTILVSRNAGYMFDWDNLGVPGNDIGENGYCRGYAGIALIYAPYSPSDSIWIEGNDTLRMVMPSVMVWWDWENDPPTDKEKYKYMNGTHPSMFGYRFMPNPLKYSLGGPFDYRVFLCSGPFKIADGETLKLVVAGGVGYGLNGGFDSVYTNSYFPGIRHVIDAVIKEYYRGSQISDPYHPSGPGEDYHWGVPPYSFKEKFYKSEKLIFDVKPNIIYKKGYINLFLPCEEKINLYLYDAGGRKIKEIIKDKILKGNLKIELPGDLSKGIYFLNLKLNKKSFVKKIVYMR